MGMYLGNIPIVTVNDLPYMHTEIVEAFISRQTANGANILDPSPAVVEMIKGKTVKSTNLIPFPYSFSDTTAYGITIKKNDDVSITFTGTATIDFYIKITQFKVGELPIGTYYCSGSNDDVILIVDGYIDGKLVKNLCYGNKNFTVDFNGYDMVAIFVYIKKDRTVDDTIYPMLNEGSTAKPFVPYFSGLKHANFKSIKSTGKQLIQFPYRIVPGTVNGVDITVNKDGTILFNGTAEKLFYPTMCILYPETLPKGTYALSGKPIGDITIGVDAKTANGKWIKALIRGNGTFTLDWDGYERIDIFYIINSGVVLDNLMCYPMLNFGDTAQPREPYKVEEYTDGNSYELPEYDYINPQTGELVKATETIIFDGTEEWFVEDTLSSYRIGLLLADNEPHNAIYDIPNIVSNLYETVTPANTFEGIKGITIHGNILYVYDGNYATNDISLWKAYLAKLYANGTPLVAEYKLVTPTITPLTDYPKEYTAYNGGSETVEQGDTDNSQWGALPITTINYREKLTGNTFFTVPIIKRYGKQLIPFPYRIVPGTVNGVDITVNKDGTILFNGTSEKPFYPTMCILYPETLPKGTYTLSGNPTDVYVSICADAKMANGKWVKVLNIKGGSFDVDWNGYERIDIFYVIQSGAVLDNLTVYPMLNIGPTAQPFEPYKEPWYEY